MKCEHNIKQPPNFRKCTLRAACRVLSFAKSQPIENFYCGYVQNMILNSWSVNL